MNVKREEGTEISNQIIQSHKTPVTNNFRCFFTLNNNRILLMIKKSVMLSVLIISFTLLSCASNKPSDKRAKVEPYVEFSTHLKSDGSKNFTYTETYPKKNQSRKKKPKGKRGKGGGRDGAQGDSGKRQNKGQRNEQNQERINRQAKRKEKFYKSLDETLATKAYCMNGYVELEFRTKHGDMQLIGDCIEKASEDDMQKFFSN